MHCPVFRGQPQGLQGQPVEGAKDIRPFPGLFALQGIGSPEQVIQRELHRSPGLDQLIRQDMVTLCQPFVHFRMTGVAPLQYAIQVVFPQ